MIIFSCILHMRRKITPPQPCMKFIFQVEKERERKNLVLRAEMMHRHVTPEPNYYCLRQAWRKKLRLVNI